MRGLVVSGVNAVDADPVTLKASIHAGSTGLTGLTGYLAHVRAYDDSEDAAVM
jgi:hypothetical protein